MLSYEIQACVYQLYQLTPAFVHLILLRHFNLLPHSVQLSLAEQTSFASLRKLLQIPDKPAHLLSVLPFGLPAQRPEIRFSEGSALAF